MPELFEIIIKIMPRRKLTTCLNIYHLQHYDNKLVFARDFVSNTPEDDDA